MLDLSMGMLISGTVIGAAGMLLLLRGKRESEPSSLLAGLALSVLPLVMHSVGMLWLAGAARTDIVVPSGLKVDVETVYHAAPLPVDPAQLSGPAVMLVHSKRAARRLADLVRERSGINLVAISPAVSAAAGDGWRRVEVAPHPDDGEMVAIAAKLCHEAR